MNFAKALDKNQAEHVKRIIKILGRYPFAIDRSKMGAGKTFAACAVAEVLKFDRIVVVCPAIMENEWKKILNGERGVEKISSFKSEPIILSYEAFRGMKPKLEKIQLNKVLQKNEEEYVTYLSNGKRVFASSSSIDDVSSPIKEEEYIPLNSHDLLYISIIPDDKNKPLYIPSPKLYEILKEQTLFVFDEYHKAKNSESATHDAVTTLVKTVYEFGGKSRVLLLSGTPFDKEKHALSLAQLLGIVKTEEMSVYNKSKRITELTGLNDIVQFIKIEIDRLKPEDPTPNYFNYSQLSVNAAQSRLISYRLIVDIVLPAISSSIVVDKENIICPTSPQKTIIHRQKKVPNDDKTTSSAAALSCANLFVKLPQVERQVLEDALSTLETVVRYDPETKTTVFGNVKVSTENFTTEDKNINSPIVKKKLSNWGELTIARMRVEKAKLKAFYRLAHSIIINEPNAKVVIALNYLDSISEIVDLFNSDGPESPFYKKMEVIIGATPKSTRTEIIDKFEKPDMNSTNLIIASISVISHGVSLDDQHGGRPRFALASANYNAIDMHQFVRRFYRRNTKGIATVRFVYGNVSLSLEEEETKKEATEGERTKPSLLPQRVLREDHIMASLSRKASVLRESSGLASPKKSPNNKCKDVGNILYADEYPEIWLDTIIE